MLNTEFYFLFEMWSTAKSAKRLTRISVLTGRNAHHLVLGISPARMCSVCTVGLWRIEQRNIDTGWGGLLFYQYVQHAHNRSRED